MAPTESESVGLFNQHWAKLPTNAAFRAVITGITDMTLRNLPLLASALMVLGCATTTPARAETDFGQVAIYVAHMLENQHYSHKEFDNDMSAKVLENYLTYLDSRHTFFTQQDVDKFRTDFSTTLDDHVMLRDISPATTIYDVYKTRVKERVDYVKKLLADAKFTFDSNRTVDLKREKLPWPKDKAAADVLWHDLIESEMLQEHLSELAKASAEAKKADKKAKKAEAKEKEKENGADTAAAKPETPKPEVKKDAQGKPLVFKADEKKPDEPPAQRIAKDYQRLLDTINENTKEDVVNFFLSCLATAYDPHTEYMSQREMEDFNVQMKHSLFGIGALLGMKDDAAEIQGIVMGGPADKEGSLKLKDKIIAVAQGNADYVETKSIKQLQKIVAMIRGKEGSTVRLKVMSPSDSIIKEISIVRGTVELKDQVAHAELIVTPNAMGPQEKIGWINLKAFYADMEEGKVSTTKDVERLLRRLMKEGMQGLVLDLRGNGGGSLDEAIKLTGLFISAGPVVQVKDWRDDISFRECSNDKPVYDGPMIVLTDKSSASASEILAAALQDYHRAIIIGDKSTYGKGTVQTILPVERYMPFFADKSRAGSLKVTIQKFYRIAGGSTQLKGVIPDLQLPSLRDVMDYGEASSENALPYDEIPALPYTFSRKTPFPAAELKSRMDSRVKGNAEFIYIADEAKRLKARIDKNKASLNAATREKEREENEARRSKYEDDRDARAKQVTDGLKGDGFKVYHLTLDNVDKPDLVVESALTREQSTGMRVAARNKDDDDDESSDELSKYPYGFEPTKLETMHVLRDLIELNAGQHVTAKTEK